VVLSGLSDTAESVREVALRAGQVMVSCLGTRHALLLLPSLQEGLFDEDWRIRHSSLSLLGDLLFLTSETRVTPGGPGAAADDEVDEDGMEDEGTTGTTSAKAVATLRVNLVCMPPPQPSKSISLSCYPSHS
jgi:hypothetical protein